MTDVWTLLQARRRTSPGAPVVTFVDGPTGGRTELSATSVENAAAKIANALRDEFDLDAGAIVGLRLPLHWQRSTWCAGAWTAGCVVDLDGDPTTVDLMVVAPDDAAGMAAESRNDVAVVSMHPFGLPSTEPLPDGAVDVTLSVRQQPDAYLFEPPSSGMPALRWRGLLLHQDEVLDMAADRAKAWGLAPGGRLLVGDHLEELDGWLACLAVPLAADAAVVLAHGVADGSGLEQREGITAVATSP